MRRWATHFGALVLLLFSGSALTAAHLTARAAPPPGASAQTFLSVPPPRGATQTARPVEPAMRIGSPYLRLQAQSYRVSLTPGQIYAYYAPRLVALGYGKRSGMGKACGPKGCYSFFWSMSRGPDDMAILTADPDGSATRYSLTREWIVAPPRPAGSLVTADVRSVALQLRPRAGAPAVTRTVTDSATVARLRRIVNALPVDTRGTHGCLADSGARSTVAFAIPGEGTYVFTENPACAAVGGPQGVALTDLPNYELWNAVTSGLGLPRSSRY